MGVATALATHAAAAPSLCHEVSRRTEEGEEHVRIVCPDDDLARQEALRIAQHLGRQVYNRSWKLARKLVSRYTIYRDTLTVDVLVGGCAKGSTCWANGKAR